MFRFVLILCASLAAIAADAPKPAKMLRVPLNAGFEPNGVLKPGDLKASINGTPVPVKRISGVNDDMILLLAFDTVGDIALIEQAKAAIIERLKTVPRNVWIGVLRTNEGMQVLSDPTPDREATARAIAAVPSTGKAAMLDTILTVTNLAESMTVRSGVRASVIYISDSDVANYREDFTNPVVNSSDSRDLSRRFPEGLVREKISKINETLSALQSPVFFVHLNYRTDRLNEAYQSGLLQLATTLGGDGRFCRSQGEIPAVIDRIFDQAITQRLVWLEIPIRRSSNISVELKADTPLPPYRTRYAVRQ